MARSHRTKLENLRTGNAKSCGCRHLEVSAARFTSTEPVPPPVEADAKLEVKARSETTVCSSKWERLRVLLGDSLVEPERAKTRELSERLYPELLAA